MTTHTAHDPFGLPLSPQHITSAAPLNDFVEGFLGYEPRILNVLEAAETDTSLIVQTYAAVLQLFSEAAGGAAAALAHLQRAQAAALPATDREQRLAQAVALWAQGDIGNALAGLESIAQDHPRDLASIKLAQYLAFNLGDSPTMLRLALLALPAAPEVAWTHGLLAFAWEQTHHLHQAEAAAREALRLQPSEAWAQHALAHVLLTTGRLQEGRDFLRPLSSGWQRLGSFLRTHNWWHLAVFELELGHSAQALHLYDTEVWGVDKRYTQDQVGAVSLLARLELAGVNVGSRWDELAPWLLGHVADQVQPFLDLQYLYGLARAGHPEAAALLARIEAFAPQAPAAARAAWQGVAVPAARGLLAYAQGQWEAAASQLELALPRLVSIGGSHAQRDLFEQIRIDALQRAGQLSGVQNLLQPRANAQPQSVLLKQRLGAVNKALGLQALA
jgi:tetratricopeptide (TPR) repeat protein